MSDQHRQPKSEFEQPVENAKRLIGLKDSAFKDYVAARILFLNNPLHQAAYSANTCIEKETEGGIVFAGG